MKLFELSEGSENRILYMFNIGDQLGFDIESTTNIVQYLKGEGLLEFRALGGGISITHNGIRQVEHLKANKLELIKKENNETANIGKENNQIDSINRGLQEFQSKIAEEDQLN